MRMLDGRNHRTLRDSRLQRTNARRSVLVEPVVSLQWSRFALGQNRELSQRVSQEPLPAQPATGSMRLDCDSLLMIWPSLAKLMHGIHVVVARNYIDNLREEVKKGMRKKAEQGTYPSRHPRDAETTMEVDPEQAPVENPFGPKVLPM